MPDAKSDDRVGHLKREQGIVHRATSFQGADVCGLFERRADDVPDDGGNEAHGEVHA